MGYDEEYRTTGAYFGAAPEEILAAHRHLLDGDRPVLDVGAGQGRNALFLARDGFTVHAIDPSAVAVETIARTAEREQLTVRAEQVGIEDFTPDVESFGGILVFGIFPVLRCTEIDALVRRVERWTSEGSLLFVVAFTVDDPSYAPRRAAGTEIGPHSFEGSDGEVRTFLEAGELPTLFPSFRPVHHREYLGSEHRHGDGPLHCHGLAEAVLAR